LQASGSGLLAVYRDDTSFSSIVPGFQVNRNSYTPASIANGFGVAVSFGIMNPASGLTAGQIGFRFTDVASNPRKTEYTFSTTDADGVVIRSLMDRYGFRYAADYSANFVARSLVDKAYVDGAIAGIPAAPVITASNGLTRTVNDIALGGALTGNTTIGVGGNTFIFDTTAPGSANFEVGGAGYFDAVRFVSDNFYAGYNDVIANASIRIVGSVLNLGKTSQARQVFNSNTITVTGNAGFTGIQYAADYSANFVARSLVDKGYVDGAITAATPAAITASNGLTRVTNDIRLGGTLTQTVTITSSSDAFRSFGATLSSVDGQINGAFSVGNTATVGTGSLSSINNTAQYSGGFTTSSSATDSASVMTISSGVLTSRLTLKNFYDDFRHS